MSVVAGALILRVPTPRPRAAMPAPHNGASTRGGAFGSSLGGGATALSSQQGGGGDVVRPIAHKIRDPIATGLLRVCGVGCLAVFQPLWAHHFDEPGRFFAPKLTDLYRTPGLST